MMIYSNQGDKRKQQERQPHRSETKIIFITGDPIEVEEWNQWIDYVFPM